MTNIKITKTKKLHINTNLLFFQKSLVSKAKKDIKFSDIHKKNISLNRRGISLSKEAYERISKKLKGRKIPNTEVALKNLRKSKCKPILQYDLQDNLIKEWECTKDVSKELGLNQANISYCLTHSKKNGRPRTYKGFIWKFKTI